jgi:hypothetical protein
MRYADFFHRLGMIVAIGAAPVPGRAAQAPTPGAVVELPTYTVTTERELPPPENWYYTRIGGQEVLSSASRRRTEEMARDITQLVHALDLTGSSLVPKPKVPLRIVIAGQPDQFLNLAPHAQESGETEPESADLGGAESPVLVINATAHSLDATTAPDAAEVEPGTAEASTPTLRAANAIRRLQVGYFRALLAQQRPPLPPWFIEGLAHVLAWVRITESSVTLGFVEDPNKRGEIGGIDREPGRRRLGDVRHESTALRDSLAYDLDFNAALAHSALFSMPELFSSDLHTFPGTGNAAQLVRWQKQCHAFVHWGLFGDYGRNEKPFLAFMKRLQTEPLTEQLFQECFGMNYQAALATLRNHVEMTRVTFVGVKVDRGQQLPPAPTVEVREATRFEVARLKSIAYTAGGQPGKAREELVLAYRRGERDPTLLADLGLAELAANDPERARKFLEAAFAGKTVGPRAHVELARLRFAEALARPAAPDGRLDAAQVAHVLEPLKLARSQPPPLPETYRLLGAVWQAGAVAPGPAQRLLLDEGARLFPRDAELEKLRAALPPAPAKN